MKEQKPHLQVILEWVKKVIEYSSEISEEDFWENSLVVDAILMQLVHIWESTRKYALYFWSDPDLPIFEMISLRNFIAHDYLGLNYDILYDVVKNNIPEIHTILEKKIKNL